jgi:peptidoglycan/xylan/chitin deacetylase (PgdA/CDA1 family)
MRHNWHKLNVHFTVAAFSLVVGGMLSCSTRQNQPEPKVVASTVVRSINQTITPKACLPIPPEKFAHQFLDHYDQQRWACQLRKDPHSNLVGDAIVIRSFDARFAGRRTPESFVLSVNPQTLETQILNADCVSDCKTFDPETEKARWAYARALTQTTNTSGTTHQENARSEVYLTADLCPSKNPIDRELFDRIQSLNPPGTPLALSVAGGWIRHHQTELTEIKKLATQGRLQITWINHSYSHPYDKDLPVEHNFLLKTGVHLEHEVFDTERLMIFNGLLPSVFFRFPGLVSNNTESQKLRLWGLIPVSADAWLAKGQKIKMGSIVLVHANGNEPQGLTLLYKQLASWPELKSLFGQLADAFSF